MGYPNPDAEIDLLLDQKENDPTESLKPVLTRADLLALQKLVRQTTVDRKVVSYLVDIVSATRRDSRLRVGGSPRGSKMLLRAAQARAVQNRRDFVLPDDIQILAPFVLAHRVASRTHRSSTSEMLEVLNDIVQQIQVPV